MKSLLSRSKRTILLAGAGILILFADSMAQPFDPPLSPRIANYTIDVTLDAEKKTLSGTERLVWKNVSKDVVRELQFHLYLNAFKNTESTFMKESGGRSRNFSMGEDGWGWIDVTSMSAPGNPDLLQSSEFIHPDDNNSDDQTVLRVPLNTPVLPGRSIVLDISFTAKLPKVFARSGYHKNFFMVAQWFPKIGVYEVPGQRYATVGGWNCHQYHASTEYYADYGVYDVSITVPDNFVVGASGMMVNDTTNADGTRTVSYHAEDVHDFAWTASPDYVVVRDKWEHIDIRLLIQPQHLHHAERYLGAVKAALSYMNDAVGLYPYSTLTIVDPAYGAMGAGGMEYPTLFTATTFWGMGEELKMAELVTVHEFIHEYFYGLVGSNEFEEAWLDEGFTNYYETRVMDATYGPERSAVDLGGFHIGDLQMTRATYTGMTNPKIAPIGTPGWKFTEGGYSNLTYAKTATVMTTLERMIGREAMDSVMKTYFGRWKFRHPSGRNFIQVVNEIVPVFHRNEFGENMNWFFDQLVYGTDVCDYAVKSISNTRITRPRGVLDDSTSNSDEGTDKGAVYKSKVVVSRLGEVRMPVDILVTFENGDQVRERWGGQERWAAFEYERPDKLESAVVDPDQVLLVDINFINNSKTLQPKTGSIWKYTIKALFWIQNLLQTAAIPG